MQPSRREQHRLDRRPVQPVSIVDQAEHRGHLGEQRQRAHADEEPIPGAGRAVGGLSEAKRGRQRSALRAGQRAETVQGRPDELVQPGERQFRLGFDADGA